ALVPAGGVDADVFPLPEREGLPTIGYREAESDIQCVHKVPHSKDSPRRVSRSGGGSFRGREGKRDGLAESRRLMQSSRPWIWLRNSDARASSRRSIWSWSWMDSQVASMKARTKTSMSASASPEATSRSN